MQLSSSIAAMFAPGAQNRLLVLCVIGSLALHALVLMLPWLHAGAPAPALQRMLTATFSPRAPPPVPLSAEPEAGKPAEPQATEDAEPRTAKRAEREATERTEPQAVKRAQPQATVPAQADRVSPERDISPRPESPGPDIPAPRPVPGPVAARAPEVPAAAAPSAESASAAGNAAAPGAVRPAAPASAATPAVALAARSGSDADAGTLEQYRLALIVAARRYKRYPAQAIDKGWQGRVEVRLAIGANGMTQSSRVTVSSGHEILDSQALDMVKKAKPLAPIPPALRGREFTVDIPVIFDLQAG